MKIENFAVDGQTATFSLTGARAGQANALRRSINGSIACFAIDKITFYENTSSMFDEYIAHRVGLVPIKTPTSGYNEKDEILFTLEAAGPSTVYSKDLVSADKEVEVANEAIPIIKLGPDQKIRIEGKAIMGTGAKHSKFQAGLAGYEPAGKEGFSFSIESFGQMSPSEMVNKAVASIRDELKEVEKNAKKL